MRLEIACLVEQRRYLLFGIARTTPRGAAAQILTGVERDRRRITVGPDGRAIDLISRLPAGFYQRVLVTGSRLDRRFRSGRGA